MFVCFAFLNKVLAQTLKAPLKLTDYYYKQWDKVLLNFHFLQSSFEYIFHWNSLIDPYFTPASQLVRQYKNIFLSPIVNIISTIQFLQDYRLYTTMFYRSQLLLKFAFSLRDTLKRTFSFGFFYLRGLFCVFFIDACLTDDEPLWEPIEWSLVQTWILFIFSFAWIAENLISSRYGSYTGRDKRVWVGWYKTFWLIEGFYILNYGLTATYVIVPFYFELNYNLALTYSWWHWYSRVFFFQFISLYSAILLIAYILQINLRWFNWRKSIILIFLITIFIGYLIYTHFIIVFFGYFTDPLWYQKTKPIDYIQLSHEPSRWGWGPAKKDHFTYHNVKTVFWFKNDGPFASSFLMFHLFLFLCLFFLFIFWISLLRRVWATKEVPTTFTTYCVSSLKQFFYFFLFFYIFIFLSFLTHYMRLPWEFYYFLNYNSWFHNFADICMSYFC